MSLNDAIANNGMPKAPEAPMPEQVEPVSPSLDPRVIRGQSGFAERARREFGEVQGLVQKLNEFSVSVRSDTTLNQDAKDLTVYSAKRAAGARATEQLAQLLDASESQLASAAKALSAEVSPSRYGQELRAHLKGLTEAQRRMEIERMVGRGQLEELTAVLDAPLMLSGLDLDKAAVQKLRERAVRARHPERAAHLDELRQVNEAVRTAFVVAQEVLDVPNPRLEVLQAKARRRTEAGVAIGLR